MDEEQKSNIDPIAEILQRPKQKINVDSFFNRSADAESITAISLKLASVIDQIDVMRTEIKDIATYITVEHKIEKDLREDRLFEEQDAKQKKEMKDRVLAKGEQVPKTAKGEAPQEESKGGGFFSGLMKIVGGLGLVAGLAALAPIILKVMGGLLITTVAVAIAKPLFNWVKGTFDKFKNFLDKTFKPVEKIPVVGKPLKNVLVGGLTGGLPGIAIAAATSISNALKNAGKGGSIEGAGGSGPRAGGAVKESNLNLEENNSGKDMANTLEKKGVIKENKVKEDQKNKVEDSSELKLYADYIEEGAEIKVIGKGDFAITYPNGREQIISTLGMGGEGNTIEEKFNSTITNLESFKKERAERKAISDKKFESDFFKNVEGTKNKKVNLDNLIPENEPQREDFPMGRSGAKEFNDARELYNASKSVSVVVPKNEPQVSSAEIKVTGTTLAYARALQNPYLSITNKKIPPELSRIG